MQKSPTSAPPTLMNESNYFSEMAHDSVRLIFSFLCLKDITNAARTCKLFAAIAKSESLWRSVSLQHQKYDRNLRTLWTYHSSEVRELDLSYCTSKYTVQDIWNKFPTLEKISFAGFRGASPETYCVFNSQLSLKVLNISSTANSLPENFVSNMLKAAPNLRVLIASCSGLGNWFFYSLTVQPAQGYMSLPMRGTQKQTFLQPTARLAGPPRAINPPYRPIQPSKMCYVPKLEVLDVRFLSSHPNLAEFLQCHSSVKHIFLDHSPQGHSLVQFSKTVRFSTFSRQGSDYSGLVRDLQGMYPFLHPSLPTDNGSLVHRAINSKDFKSLATFAAHPRTSLFQTRAGLRLNPWVPCVPLLPDRLNNTQLPPFLLALCTDFSESFDLFLSHLPHVNILLDKKHKDTPLIAAALAGKPAVIEALLSRDADPNHKNAFGWTALHYAAAKGHTKIVQLLIEAQANVDARDSNQVTPLVVAFSNSQRQVIDFLLSHGASWESSVSVSSPNSNNAAAPVVGLGHAYVRHVSEPPLPWFINWTQKNSL